MLGTRLDGGTLPVRQDYRPFPNVHRRNRLQEALEIPVMARLLDIPKGQRILEVGCGRGNAFAAIHRLCRPSRLAGLDIDGSLLASAAAAAETGNLPVDLVRADVRNMPFADGSFDLVLDFGTCYHIARPETALQEIARVLRPGGVFITESRTNQRFAHPDRASGDRLPWAAAPGLVLDRHAVLWSRSFKDIHQAAQGYALAPARPFAARAFGDIREGIVAGSVAREMLRGRLRSGRSVAAESGMMPTHRRLRPFNTRDTYPEQALDNDLCQAVVAGNTVYLRGQVGQNLETAASVGIGDPVAQAEQAMQNVAQLLNEAGSRLEDIVKIVVYLTDVRYREPVYRVIGRWLKGVYPVSTGIVVTALARPEWLVEIDVTAVIPAVRTEGPEAGG